MKCQVKFLSTLSLRRATLRPTGNQPITPNFYPRSPCGERLEKIRKLKSFVYFYPRSPCGERLMLVESFSDNRHFYPRSPCGERHLDTRRYDVAHRISIHALLAESDIMYTLIFADPVLFLSTLSLRRATPGTSVFRGWTLFLSTLSLRRATCY